MIPPAVPQHSPHAINHISYCSFFFSILLNLASAAFTVQETACAYTANIGIDFKNKAWCVSCGHLPFLFCFYDSCCCFLHHISFARMERLTHEKPDHCSDTTGSASLHNVNKNIAARRAHIGARRSVSRMMVLAPEEKGQLSQPSCGSIPRIVRIKPRRIGGESR